MGWIENRNLGKDERRAKMKVRRLCESEWVHERAGALTRFRMSAACPVLS